VTGRERLPNLMFLSPAGPYDANLFTPVGGSVHHNLPGFMRLHSGWRTVERKKTPDEFKRSTTIGTKRRTKS
jgi:hypothetical protein